MEPKQIGAVPCEHYAERQWHAVARSIARNAALSVDRAAYMKRKARQHGFAVVALAERYAVAIAQAEAANPDRCRAFIDDEAERIVRGMQ